MNKWTQTDKRWAKDNMAIEGDTIEKWGCFLTSLANVIGTDPGSLNEIFKIQKIYNGPSFPGEESSIDTYKLRTIMKVSLKKVTYAEVQTFHSDNYIVCIRDIASPSGKHYCNLLDVTNRYIIYWDVYNGIEKTTYMTDVIGIYMVSI